MRETNHKLIVVFPQLLPLYSEYHRWFIFSPHNRLFFLPLWDSAVLEQWLLHNRYRNDYEFNQTDKKVIVCIFTYGMYKLHTENTVNICMWNNIFDYRRRTGLTPWESGLLLRQYISFHVEL